MKNPEADELLLQLTELFNIYLAMWHNYEPEGASCFLSPLLEFAVNAHMKYEPNALKFDANKCLWKVSYLQGATDRSFHLNISSRNGLISDSMGT